MNAHSSEDIKSMVRRHTVSLITNGFNEVAERIVLMQGQRDLGGWCIQAIEDHLYELAQEAYQLGLSEREK